MNATPTARASAATTEYGVKIVKHGQAEIRERAASLAYVLGFCEAWNRHARRVKRRERIEIGRAIPVRRRIQSI